MSILSRRDFLIGLATVSASCSLSGSTALAAISNATIIKSLAPELSGNLVAVSYLGNEKSSVFSFDLSSGIAEKVKIDMGYGHDALKIGDNYLVLPKSREPAYAVNFDGEQKKLTIPDGVGFSGHGLYDVDNNRVIATAYDHTDRLTGYFVIIDPKNFKVEEVIPSQSYNPHDLCFLDEETIALCAYNTRQGTRAYDSGLSLRPHDEYSQIVLYDRKTLKPKQYINAYREAAVSHMVVTNDKQIFATGNQEFKDKDVADRSPEYWKNNLKDYFLKSQPEIESEYLDIINHINPHRVEKSTKVLGLPLPNLVLPYGADKVQKITANPGYHRRAQSICYNSYSNVVGVSYPNTDGIMLIKAGDQSVSSLSIADTGLPEVRGITAVEDSNYIIAAGHHKDFAVIDTVTSKVVKTYEADIGRTIHLHHTTS